MAIIKNRTELNGEILSLVANGAVGNFTTKNATLPNERNLEEGRTM